MPEPHTSSSLSVGAPLSLVDGAALTRAGGSQSHDRGFGEVAHQTGCQRHPQLNAGKTLTVRDQALCSAKCGGGLKSRDVFRNQASLSRAREKRQGLASVASFGFEETPDILG